MRDRLYSCGVNHRRTTPHALRKGLPPTEVVACELPRVASDDYMSGAPKIATPSSSVYYTSASFGGHRKECLSEFEPPP